MSGNVKSLNKYIRMALVYLPALILTVAFLGALFFEMKKYNDYVDNYTTNYYQNIEYRLENTMLNGIRNIDRIRTSAWREDEEHKKRDVLSTLQTLIDDDVEYYFAGTYDGISLLGPATGQNMYEIVDVNGVKVVQELIKAAQAGGGFVRYVMPEGLEEVQQISKISYVVGIDDWEWYVGIGTSADEIEADVEQYRQVLLRGFIVNSSIYIFIVLIILFAFWQFGKGVYRRFADENDKVANFFLQAAGEDTNIEIEQLEFKEWRLIGEQANQLVNKRIATEQKLRWSAYHDNLTKLPNRLQIQKIVASDKIAAIAIMDVDNFKYFNDSYGHEFGDKILVNIGEILKDYSINTNTITARFGDDEFAVIFKDGLNDKEDKEKIEQNLQTLMQAINKPIIIGRIEVQLTVSVGVVTFDDKKPLDANEIIRRADLAMNYSKENGKNRYEYYTEDLYSLSIKEIHIEIELKKAIKKQQFLLYYQPIIDVKTNEVHKYEALIRWENDDGRLVSPMEFIPTAEKTGLIHEIGIWVIDEACQFIKRINTERHKNNLSEVEVSVNISAVQLLQASFVQRVLAVVERYNIPASWLLLEITETALMESFDLNISKLQQLRQKGYRVALDDFGTGYSSLNYLMKLPVNYVKIDKSFVDNIVDNERFKKITKAIIDISHELELEVVGEGVETEEQYMVLKELGCDYIQGFYKGRPVLEEDIY